MALKEILLGTLSSRRLLKRTETLNLTDTFFAFIVLGLLLLGAYFLKAKSSVLQRLYLPESVIAGILGLLLGPQVLGWICQALQAFHPNVFPLASIAQNGLFPPALRQVWSECPGVFINVVFATLFLGETIPSPAQIWRKAAPQIAFGQSLAWGQYVVGLAAVLGVLVPWFNINPISGCLIEIAFEGGHGTAAGMAEPLKKLGFPEGPDLAYILATVGIISGVIAGTLLVNWGKTRGHVRFLIRNSEFGVRSSEFGVRGSELEEDLVNSEFLPLDSELQTPNTELRSRNVSERKTPNSKLSSPKFRIPNSEFRIPNSELSSNSELRTPNSELSLNISILALTIAVGWLLWKSLQLLEALTWAKTGFVALAYMPLFPFAAIGGLLVQIAFDRLGLRSIVARPLQEHIAGVALDVVIVSAFASISLQVLGTYGFPLLILSVVGIAWNVGAFLYLGPRILPDYWFERGLGDMGQSMGVTATGILLIRMADPHNQTGALESFAYKQLLFAPIVGGGVVTAITPALIVQVGPWFVLAGMTGILVCWLLWGFSLYRNFSS